MSPPTHPTALFFLPPSADQSPSLTLTTHLTTLYNPTPLPPWSLTHRLFRETPLPTTHDKSKPHPPPQRYLQTLTLSHHAPRTYIAITSTQHAPSSSQPTRAGTPAEVQGGTSTSTGEPAALISIPTTPSSEEFITLLLSKLGPLWQQRQILGIANGQSFEINDEFRVKIGEVRQGGQMMGMGMGKGAVCEVEWVGAGADGEWDWEEAEVVIGGFWEGLGVKGGRKVCEVKGLEEGDWCVRQWFEGLRSRG